MADRCAEFYINPSPFTDRVGSIGDVDLVRRAMAGVTAIIHTATLHKPHVATHTNRDFVDTNVTGTLVLLEAAVAAGVTAFIYTSTTSAFGAALVPPPGEPAAWITEDVAPVPKNIYGVTKFAAENLCELFARQSATARPGATDIQVLPRSRRQFRDPRALCDRERPSQ